MRLLLTGSNGFLGSHVVDDAHARGWHVIGLGRTRDPLSAVDTYIRHDLAQPLPPSLVPGTVDAVVHCGALSSPWAPPQAFVTTNVTGTRNIAQWAAEHGTPHLVYISSSSVLYRDTDQFNLTENSPVLPDDEQINTYSRTKSVGERIVAHYPGLHVVLRPRAIFGVGDTVLLPRIVRLARRGFLPRLERKDNPVVIDLIDVHTAAHYITEAVSREVTGLYNLTNAEPVTLYPFLLDVLARLGVHPAVRRIDPGLVTAIATAGEQISALALQWREPPLTRFGVSVLSRSKTFDVTNARRDLGEPSVSIDEAVDRLVASYA